MILTTTKVHEYEAITRTVLHETDVRCPVQGKIQDCPYNGMRNE